MAPGGEHRRDPVRGERRGPRISLIHRRLPHLNDDGSRLFVKIFDTGTVKPAFDGVRGTQWE